MGHLYVNNPPHWNQNDQRYSESFTRSLSLKVNSPPKLHLNNLQDYQDSSSSKSTQFNHGVAPNFGTDSRDQCLSSESGQEVSCSKNLGLGPAQEKQIYTIMGLPNASYGTDQVDYDPAMGCMPLPHPGGDPYYNGLVTAYGTSPVPLMMGMTSTRVPLPVDRSISEDEPIYVNAKQYHGILRRRQSRAKMEAQNKIIKIRKPYLHESRHLHALKRVRGSGGRFLSTNKQQKPDSVNINGNHSVSDFNSFARNGNRNLEFEPVQSHVGRVDRNAGLFQQSESGYLGISST